MKNTKATLSVSSKALFTYNKSNALTNSSNFKTVVPTLPTVLTTMSRVGSVNMHK